MLTLVAALALCCSCLVPPGQGFQEVYQVIGRRQTTLLPLLATSNDEAVPVGEEEAPRKSPAVKVCPVVFTAKDGMRHYLCVPNGQVDKDTNEPLFDLLKQDLEIGDELLAVAKQMIHPVLWATSEDQQAKKRKKNLRWHFRLAHAAINLYDDVHEVILIAVAQYYMDETNGDLPSLNNDACWIAGRDLMDRAPDADGIVYDVAVKVNRGEFVYL